MKPTQKIVFEAHPPVRQTCKHIRLAESTIAAVDVCACGMMRLHMGAFTLRMAPCAVAELHAILGCALARHAAGEGIEAEAEEGVGQVIPFTVGGRGDA